MFVASEADLIEEVIRQDGLSEQNCLDGLTDQQLRVWVRSALLGESIEEIISSVFRNRKYMTESTVRYVLDDARLRIVANLFRDADIMLEARHKPRMRAKVQALIDRVMELKKKKGCKIPCRRSPESN